MRKIATILISMLLVLIPLSASTDEAVLDIKAYKLGGAGEFIELTITDALNKSLNVVGTNTDSTETPKLDITDYIDDYLGRLPSGETSSNVYGDVLFSYRLDGTVQGKYDIDVTLSPFEEDGEGTDCVDAYFALQNENVVFNATNKTESADGFSISLLDSGTKSDVTGTENENDTSHKNVKLKTSIQIAGPDNANSSSDIWIARGAVFAIISRQDYESVSNNEYRSTVTVTVTNMGE